MPTRRADPQRGARSFPDRLFVEGLIDRQPLPTCHRIETHPDVETLAGPAAVTDPAAVAADLDDGFSTTDSDRIRA